uniref:Ig-like domain-containing protein n=1 Tax=Cyprinus carpio carpio TaxID=630221 RepID=A0A9J8BHE1_CYPCA
MGSSALHLKLLLMSLVYSGLTEVTSVVNANPVTLRCDIQGGENIQLIYSLFKDGDPHDIHRTTEAEFSFTADVSDSGVYSCRGERSDTSAAVTLTVSVKAEVKVTPDQRVFRGETVTLTCDIQGGGNIQWTYNWFKDASVIPDITERVYTITSLSNNNKYSCEATRSDINSVVTLTVSDLPTSTLTVTPDSPVFTGERVSLKCVINSDHSDWRYEWNKGSVMLQTSERYTVNTDTLTITAVTTSDAGQFWCRGQRDERPKSSQSSSVSLTVTDLPTSTLTVTPDNPVFTGERVDLKCMIESHSDWRQRNGLTYDRGYDWTYYQTAEWRYEWYKGSVMLQTSERYTVNTDTLTIRAVTTSDAGQFWCRGEREKRPNSSQSSSVSLTVKDSPTSTLTVTPDSPVFTGERVSLKCEIESYSNWRYEWHKDSVMLQTSERYTVNRDTLTITAVTTSDAGQFWCRGQRDKRPNSSQSSSVPVTVKGVSPSVSLVVRPSRSQHFSSDSLSLSCEDQRNSAGWTVRRYTDRNTEDCSKLSGSTCRLVSLSTSDAGVYWCQSESGEKSHRLKISVHDGDVILESSVDPVIEGHTLTLHCLHRSTNSPILRADFYKDGSLVQNQTTGEMIITTVSKSHEGFYYCKTERGQSLHSWISVREKKENHADLEQHGVSRSGQISVYNILSFLLAACPYLLATVVLLYKYYRARVPSTEDQSQYAVTEEET